MRAVIPFHHHSSAHLCPRNEAEAPEPASSGRLSACSPSHSQRSEWSQAEAGTPPCTSAKFGSQSPGGNPPRYPQRRPHQRPHSRLLSDLHPLKQEGHNGSRLPPVKVNKASREASHLFLHHTFSFKMVAFPKKKDWRISAERRLWFQSPTYTRARAHIRLYSCHFISVLSLTDDSKLQLNVKRKCKI